MSGEEKPPRGRTLCYTCGGAGVVPRERVAKLHGQVATVVASERCPQCPEDPESQGRSGTGWLPGIQPPV